MEALSDEVPGAGGSTVGPKALGQVLAQSGLFWRPSQGDVRLKDTWLRSNCPTGLLGRCRLQTQGRELGHSLSSLNLAPTSLAPTASWYQHSLDRFQARVHSLGASSSLYGKTLCPITHPSIHNAGVVPPGACMDN